MNVLIFLLLATFPQETFTQFQYCRENSRGPYESQCIQLDPDGAGEVRFKRRDAEEVQGSLALSADARERFLEVLKGTGYLSNGDQYESKRQVADLGRKHLVIEMPSGRREAEFNYSDRKEVTALVQFFEGILNQETLMFDLDLALQFERLSVPERLEQLERELKAKRISDPGRLVPVLEKIEGDARLMNFARTHAKRLKDEVAKTDD